jgi:hypothetical protein
LYRYIVARASSAKGGGGGGGGSGREKLSCEARVVEGGAMIGSMAIQYYKRPDEVGRGRKVNSVDP